MKLLIVQSTFVNIPSHHCILFAEETVTVIYPYDGTVKDDLAMKPGDVITVDDWDVSDDWARGTVNGKTGLFYKDCTKPSSEVPSPDDFILKEVRGKQQGYEATYQGREYILKEKLDEVECIICHQLADNVHQTSCCGNTVCLQCTNSWKKRNDSCPQCRKQPLKVIEDPKTQRRIAGATVYCPNYHFGCDWVGSFSRVVQHLATNCNNEIKRCPNSQCKVSIPKEHLATHKDKLCLWRRDTCPCYEYEFNYIPQGRAGRKYFKQHRSLTYHDIIMGHDHVCPNWPVRCPNSCDPYLTLRRCTVDKHVKEECPETVVECTFAEVGCKVNSKVKRKDMAQHLHEAVTDHMTAMFTDHMELKRENAKLKEEMRQLKARMK